MTIDIHFDGDRFYPSIIKDELLSELDIHNEYGVIAKKGRHKGEPAPYGFAMFMMPEELEVKDCYGFFDTYINLLYNNKDIIIKSGCSGIEFSINSDFIFILKDELIEKLTEINGEITNNPY